ncbi:LysR family transcriptional regulator [Dactylosporangium sp. NPDC005555]|uniref:LysR family transcriptional regulator n=1 Tax=Dactylosporangium sp. NPDC005555 TaxID=3154889 RepID=UPI0033A1D18B
MLNNERLLLLAELARLGSMREVAEELGTTTSTVSQQLAVLAREAGTALLEPDGRRVRLTPAGRRLARHAVTILAAVEAARLDLDPSAEPAGTVRVAGFATAIRRSLLPIVAALPARHPALRVLIHEHEPAEALQLLAGDEVDLALTYDYNLAPTAFPGFVEAGPLWTSPWSLGVPSGSTVDGEALDVFRHFRDTHWLVNSRNTADEDVVRTVASMAGITPRIAHRADSLDLIQDLIVAGLGVGLLPADQPTIAGVSLVPLRNPDVRLRAFAVTRLGRRAWPPLAVVLSLLCGT